MSKEIGLTLDRLFYRTLMVNPDEKIIYKDTYLTYKDFLKIRLK